MAKKNFAGVGESIFNKERERPEGQLATKDSNFSLDFAIKDDATREELEAGIENTLQGQRLSAIAVAIAMDRIDFDSKWMVQTHIDETGKRIEERTKYKNAKEYWDEFAQRIDMSPASVSRYRNAGRVYRENKKLLDGINFRERGSLGKLLHIEKAVKLIEDGIVEQAELKKILISGSEKDLVKMIESVPRPPKLEVVKAETNVRIEGMDLLVDERHFATFDESAPPEFRRAVFTSLKEEARRKAANLDLIPVEVEPEEKSGFERDIMKLREIRDKGHRPYIIEVPVEKDDPGLYQALNNALTPFIDRVVKEYWAKR